MYIYIFFLYILGLVFCVCILSNSADPQSPAHGTVPSQVATHLSRLTEFTVCWGGAGFEHTIAGHR
jgi:hypothetical protein